MQILVGGRVGMDTEGRSVDVGGLASFSIGF
jgi:hypothetical protein